jgi:hypothetical protein
MTEKVTQLHDKDAGVVDFGVQRSGFTAIVEGREIPRLMVKERGPDKITINLDNRWEIDVPRELSGSICWMVANALAIGEGYAFLGSPNKDKPFAPEVIGPFGASE